MEEVADCGCGAFHDGFFHGFHHVFLNGCIGAFFQLISIFFIKLLGFGKNGVRIKTQLIYLFDESGDLVLLIIGQSDLQFFFAFGDCTANILVGFQFSCGQLFFIFFQEGFLVVGEDGFQILEGSV